VEPSTTAHLVGWAYGVSACVPSLWEQRGWDQTGHAVCKMAHFHLRGSGHPWGRVTQYFVVRPQACMLSRRRWGAGDGIVQLNTLSEDLTVIAAKME